jgi:RNA polymerase sigma-70 factor, ECF subfamily
MSGTVDEQVRALCAEQEVGAAVARILEAYGGEILRFLLRRTADAQLATEVFAVFSEDLCRGLPGFTFRSSVRTWVYALAHHALSRVGAKHARNRARELPISDVRTNSRLIAGERSETPAFLRTETKERLLALRRRLPAHDQTLLDLRLVQRFSWKDIARVYLGPDEVGDAGRVEKEAMRLRKRFQLVGDKLREMARAEGLLPGD